MDPIYICNNCQHYSSPQSLQHICKRYAYIDIPKLPTDFCGEHSLFKKDYFAAALLTRIRETEEKVRMEEKHGR